MARSAPAWAELLDGLGASSSQVQGGKRGGEGSGGGEAEAKLYRDVETWPLGTAEAHGCLRFVRSVLQCQEQPRVGFLASRGNTHV